MQTTSVDAWMEEGCGRCDHFRTPACKVHRWTAPLALLREVLLASGLTEELKWGNPCYTLEGRNVVMLAALKESCVLSFFKGAALSDPDGALEAAGPSSRFARSLRFGSLEEARGRRGVAEAFVAQAIALERAGVKVAAPPASEPVPDALAERLAADDALRAAFEALTPGRRRSHILHIGGAKQRETRARRVERCAQEILAGRGFNER
jgi:uncharacterized protein YdeI (YjbR/CyaY-like superfamily)